MKVTIKYFGLLAEIANRTEEVLELEKGFTVNELKDMQIKKYHISDPEAVQLAINQQLNSDDELKEGDEVAFLPPFAGG